MGFWQSFTSCHDKKMKYLCNILVMLNCHHHSDCHHRDCHGRGSLPALISCLRSIATLFQCHFMKESSYIWAIVHCGVGIRGSKTLCSVQPLHHSSAKTFSVTVLLIVGVASIQCVYHQCKLSSVTRVLIARWGSALPWEPETLLLLLLQPSSSSS